MTTQHSISTDGALATSTMTAITQHRYGGPEVLGLDTLPVPSPGPAEVLVKVHAGGLDRGTWHLMAGEPFVVRMMFGLGRPKQPVLGIDVAGVVVAVGDDVTRFAVGDEVFGIARGSYAEYAVATEAKLAKKPAGVTFEQAAVTPVSGLTALQAVHDRGGVAPGQRVLVIGASGGVGSFAVQLAAAAGAHVTGVASAAKRELVRDLGAAAVLDYAVTDIASLSERFDLIIDINGRTKVGALRRLLTPHGTAVLVGGEGGRGPLGGAQRQLLSPLHGLFRSQTITGMLSTEDQGSIERLGELLAAGTITPALGAVYPLADAPRAMADLIAGRISGKAAIRVG